MVKAFPSAIKQLGSLAVIVVTLWLGGFGCSLCCATKTRDLCCLNEDQPGIVAASLTESESCDSGVGCSCCKSQSFDQQETLVLDAIGSDGFVGCSLLPRRLEGTTTTATVAGDSADADLPLPAIQPIDLSRTQSLLDAPQPLNRGGTYLRFCVLLI